MTKKLLVLFVLIFSLSACSLTPNSNNPSSKGKDIVIGFSMADLMTERWQKDRELFISKVEELGGNVSVLSANTDAKLQNTQAENLILQGVDVLVVVAQDGELAASIVEKAHAKNIPVIAYDRLIKNSDLDYYLSFDNVRVGEYQAGEVLKVAPSGSYAYVGGSPDDNNAFLVKEGAMNILQPEIDNGNIQLVFDEFSTDWRAEVAYENIKKFFSEGGKLSAIVAANDGTAGGAIRALDEVGLAGKIPVSGQDASLSACQRIVEGTQTVTVYKPIKNIADKAAEMAMALAQGRVVKTDSVVNNGQKDVPAILLDVVAVTKDNIDETVIKDGFQLKDEVYANVK